ncbi:hypothetical protein [Mucilaginibacter jinjuensis]|uniref:Dolichyl-phosphate-mannose-protein mannosyltransferase n=1 Tax=Mucilaginibacter jinjuensis TaxID=1176721 RepID=A0ABY7T661_9SPHI|nr:hypothetical protein [Mucilaginibacter jinjuensis]WCT11866.1 hypothetical protein PQO05_24340 [Mucilaginibacter jinjuensis]
MEGITALDYILLPFYLWLIYRVAYYYRDKFYPEGHAYRPYFIPGLTAKIFGAIFISMFYWYYYGGGDSYTFFVHSRVINSTFLSAPDTWLRLMTHQADDQNLTDSMALSQMYWYNDVASYTVARVGAFLGLFCFTQYLIINVLVAVISFNGIWLLFICFAQQYTHLIKKIAIAILFMPGPTVWGSGLYKDSLCMFAIGCLCYSAYILFEKKNFRFILIVLLIISILLLVFIKAYIIAMLLPAMILKIILVYKKKTSARFGGRVKFYILLGIMSIGAVFAAKKIISSITITPEDVIETIQHQKDYLLRVSLAQDGSAYNLGDFDPSINGILKMFIPAVNVTLFRPYPWESKSLIQLFNSSESTGVLLLTLYLLFTRNPFKTLKNIYTDPNLIMCLTFTLLFAFIVGVSTYNFGSLSRYKIPCTPFYMLFLMILIFKDKPEAKTLETLEEPALNHPLT